MDGTKIFLPIGGLVALVLAGMATAEPPAPPKLPGKNDVLEACTKISNMDEKTCDCVAGKAVDEFDPTGVEFLLAMLLKDQAAADKARAKASPETIIAAGTFMLRAPADCAEELATANAAQ